MRTAAWWRTPPDSRDTALLLLFAVVATAHRPRTGWSVAVAVLLIAAAGWGLVQMTRTRPAVRRLLVGARYDRGRRGQGPADGIIPAFDPTLPTGSATYTGEAPPDA